MLISGYLFSLFYGTRPDSLASFREKKKNLLDFKGDSQHTHIDSQDFREKIDMKMCVVDEHGLGIYHAARCDACS